MELKEIAIIIINAIAVTFGYSIIFNRILFAFSGKRINIIKLYVIIFAVIFSISFSEILAYEPVILFIASVVILYTNKISLTQNLLSSVVSAVTFVLIMIAQTIILAFVMDISIENALMLRETLFYNIYNSIVFIVLSMVFLYIINGILGKILGVRNIINSENNQKNKKNTMFITTTIFFSIAIISTAWLITFSNDSAEEYFLFSIIISILITLFVVYSIYATFNIVAYEKRESEIEKNKEITEIYKNEIRAMYENMRDFKHDYMKMYSSMSLLIQQERYEELKKLFCEDIVPLKNEIMNETNTNHTITQINDIIIQGIIYSYIIRANNEEINFQVGINDEVPKIKNITSFEMSRLLGIMLDNAFEAVSEISNKKHRTVKLSVYVINNVIKFVIKNKYANKPDIMKVFSNKYSTKGDGRGRGLAILKKIVDKHKDIFLSVIIDEDYFIVELKIYN